ncbi:molybdopterin-guanine dinucleotide biosynthesis protein MobA [Helicobacter cholecystus]|uniref:Probable molybdenum cofactor guanylyltransferase n=1 Tax=Helicobacter cholecystus TaxID=45498 RepID=A0A3D8IZI0_9HELI|nr:NTP transferase domain-containing protein [Helicobacter cholecystus]RDU69961.1 molybdopterin-guanine dinucleotide biosynthesis protein MobA [Helicobacter cholecystus]VEJ24873.1 molybdopterin-guanine dinucleotide biosynthesis protein A [Helicobacter cholecystus]
MPIPCVILCGGKSSRMGRDKALLPFPSEPLAVFMFKKMKKIFSSVYLSLKNTTPLLSYDVRLIQEKTGEFAPMIGIREAFETLQSQKIFFLSVDTPFITEEVIYTLLAECIEGVTYAKDSQKEHYLCGIYSKTIYSILLDLIQKQDYKMSHFIDLVPHKSMDFKNPEIFSNLNTQEHYLKALERLGQHG